MTSHFRHPIIPLSQRSPPSLGVFPGPHHCPEQGSTKMELLKYFARPLATDSGTPERVVRFLGFQIMLLGNRDSRLIGSTRELASSPSPVW